MKRKLTNALLIANYVMAHADTNIDGITVYAWIDSCPFTMKRDTRSIYNKNSILGSYSKEDIIKALNAIGARADIIVSICDHDDGTRELLFSNYNDIAK